MKKIYFILVTLLTFFNLYAQQDEFIADELIISFSESATETEIEQFLDNYNFNIIKKYKSTDNSFLIRRKGVTKKNVQQTKPSPVQIKIYNIRGQLIETLYKGITPVGYHRVEFYEKVYASGLYIYKIEAGNFVDVKKMILIK